MQKVESLKMPTEKRLRMDQLSNDIRAKIGEYLPEYINGLRPDRIGLFGSAVNGTLSPDSDYDL